MALLKNLPISRLTPPELQGVSVAAADSKGSSYPTYPNKSWKRPINRDQNKQSTGRPGYGTNPPYWRVAAAMSIKKKEEEEKIVRNWWSRLDQKNENKKRVLVVSFPIF